MEMQRRRTMSGKIDVMRLAKCGDLQETRDAAAARGVRLLDVDRAGGEHPQEVIGIVAILAGSDLHGWRRAVTQQPQPLQIVGRDRLLEPAYPLRREHERKCERLFSGI